MKYFIFVLIAFNHFSTYSQGDRVDRHFSEVDSLYREDQFYIGVGVNFLLDRPVGVRQSGFSGGLHFGFIRDMPLNKRRNLAIGIGLGLSFNTYTQNVFIDEDSNGETIFEVIDRNENFNENRFRTHLVELPFQVRWRSSSIGDDSSFWRIYSGVNFGYIYNFRSIFSQNGISIEQNDVEDLNRFRTFFYFSFGKSKINFFFKYSLNPIFDGKLQNTKEDLGIEEIKAGIVFYIL